jgi:Fe-S cluster biogenesis protein NfuA
LPKYLFAEIITVLHPLDHIQGALADLLPAMVADGGGAELVAFENGVATVKLLGSCNFCPSRQLSASALKRGLMQRVAELKDVNVIYPSIPKFVSALKIVDE